MNQSQIATIAVVAVVGVAVIGGGLALAARNAEPGDALYSLRASLYGDVSSDADVQANLTGAREAYDEARDLESRNALTATERARITARYSTHINAVLRRIAELEADGDMDAAVELRTSLRAALRDFDDIFPSSGLNAESSAATTSSVTSDDDDGEASSATSNPGQGSSSSIFFQPSSATTSA